MAQGTSRIYRTVDAEVIMRKVRISRLTVAGPMASRRGAFNIAVRAVAARIGVKRVKVIGTPAPVFSAHCSAALRRIKRGSIEVITYQGEPFIVLGMEQLFALVAGANTQRTAAELLVGLPSVSASPSIPKHRSVLKPSHHRVPQSGLE